MDSWDPIGIKDLQGPEDEYDRYVIDVTSMILNHRTSEQIADYLHQIANEWICMPTQRDVSANVAKMLSEAYSSSRTLKGFS
jgi:hypothetical protein